jgi:hypothetical protein
VVAQPLLSASIFWTMSNVKVDDRYEVVGVMINIGPCLESLDLELERMVGLGKGQAARHSHRR